MRHLPSDAVSQPLISPVQSRAFSFDPPSLSLRTSARLRPQRVHRRTISCRRGSVLLRDNYMVHRWVTRLGTSARGLGLPIHPILQASAHPKAPLCYKSPMKIIEHWLLFKYIEGQFTPLWKPFRSKDQAEKARLKLPERERRTIGVGVIRLSKNN